MTNRVPFLGWRWVWLPLLAALAAVGCGGHEEISARDDLIRRVTGTDDPGPSARFETKGLIVRAFDLNGDRTADLWKIFSYEKEKLDDPEPVLKLVRKEVDSNFDRVVDLWFLYNAKEQLYREEADANFDGKVDLVSLYEKGRLAQREVYKPDLEHAVATKHYRDGKLYKIELDEDGNGAMEKWEIYAEGRLIQVGYDVNYDGKVDYWNSFE